MPVDIDLQFVGVAKALQELRKLDPALRKEFQREATEIAQPVVDKVKDAYKFVPLSGMKRKWDGGRDGRVVFPLEIGKAQKGIKVKFDARARSTANIVIQQMDPGWAIFESAGRANPNKLSDKLEPVEPGRTRLIGRVIRANIHLIENEMDRLIRRLLNGFEKEINK